MMSESAFDELVAALIARGYPPDQAGDYAARLGDTIETDPDGRWVIRGDDGSILDRIEPL